MEATWRNSAICDLHVRSHLDILYSSDLWLYLMSLVRHVDWYEAAGKVDQLYLADHDLASDRTGGRRQASPA